MNLRYTQFSPSKVLTLVFELNSQSYVKSVFYKECYARNLSHCKNESIPGIDKLGLPMNASEPPTKMTFQTKFSEEADYVLSMVATSGSHMVESNTLFFEIGKIELFLVHV